MSFKLTFPEGILPFEGENVLARYPANRRQTWRAVGYAVGYAISGRLHVTSHRLLFLPHKLDTKIGGKKWWVLREDVANAEFAGIDPAKILSWGLRSRMKVDLSDGSSEIFVVNQPALVAQEVKSWIIPKEEI
ncbi:hypothetical protein [Parasphingorhabdus pacifica]